jgi:hypothetical protein
MRKLFVVLAAAIVFTPRLALTDGQAQALPPDSPPQTDFLPMPSGASAASFAPAPKPLLVLGLLAAISQWRLATGSAQNLTVSSTPLHSAKHSLLPALHGAPTIVPRAPRFNGYNACVRQPHRRAPPRHT